MNKCRAIVQIGDDQGDNSCTFKCHHESGHTGQHSETFKTGTKNLTMTWDGSEKVLVERFKFNLTRYIEEHRNPDSGTVKQGVETIVTELMTEHELFDKYCCPVNSMDSVWGGFWTFESYEPIEETKVSEWIYEDTLIE